MNRRRARSRPFAAALASLATFSMAVTGIVFIQAEPSSATIPSECPQTLGTPAAAAVTKVGSDCVVTFSANTTWTVPQGVTSIRLLIVGGGAGGQIDGGGGGGGGSGVTKTSVSVTPGVAARVVVGAGGSWGTGGNSTTLDLNADNSAEWVAPGGSAGTGWSTRQGGSGGVASAQNSATLLSGGRGGDGPSSTSHGTNAANSNLGDGFQSDISGTTLWYGGGGGGGMGAHANGSPTSDLNGGDGGKGGGGRGAAQRSRGTNIVWTYKLDGTTSSFTSTLQAKCGSGAAYPGATMGFPGLNGYGGGGGGGVAYGDGCAGSPSEDDGERTIGGRGGDGVAIVRYNFAPAAPTITSITPGNGQLSVAFSASASATNYEYSVDNGSSWVSINQTSSPFTISSLTNESAYTVLLRAVNGTSVSVASSGVSATPFATCSPSSNTSGGYTVLTFTSTSTCRWSVPGDVSSAEVLVVGGGGGGGGSAQNSTGGSGGAGGYFYSSSVQLNGVIKVGVGSGGSGSTSRSTRGSDGGDSFFGELLVGGGGGGNGEDFRTNTSASAGRGGSNYVSSGSGGGGRRRHVDGNNSNATLGGAAGAFSAAGISFLGATYTGIQGTAGGNACSCDFASGGLGGQISAGSRTSSISGISTEYSKRGPFTEWSNDGSKTYGSGGAANYNYGASTTGLGGDGRQGVVIIRYANTYSVTYDSKGGSSVSSGTFITGGTVSFPTSPTKSGYTFVGWSETDGGAAVSTPYSPAVTQNITLYAVWQSLVFALDATDTASYSSGNSITNLGSTGSTNNATYSGGNTVIANQSFDFPDNNTSQWIDVSGTLSSNLLQGGYTIDFYAKVPSTGSWDRIFDFAEGRGSATPNFNGTNFVVSRLDNTDRISLHVANGARAGDHSWCNSTAGVFDNTLKRYTIRANSAGCEIYVANSIVGDTTYGGDTDTNYSIPANLTWDNLYIGRANYANQYFRGELRSLRIFSGYLTPQNIDAIDSGDFTYKSITLNADGGNLNSTQSPLVTSGTLALPGSGPTRSGYSFLGWSSTQGGSNLNGSIAPTADGNVYALWSANTYNVTYDEKGGSSVADGTFTFGGAVNFPTSPTKVGYTFSGWSATDGGTVLSIPYSPGVSSDITLYAVWATTLDITTPSTGLSGTVGQPYTLNIEASGGDGTKSYSATGLPSGLTINSTTGVISGTPTTSGNSTVAVTVTDDTGSKTTSTFTISVAQVPLADASDPTVVSTPGALRSITVTWTAVPNATSYTIKLYDAAGTSLLHTITGASGTSRTITLSDYSSLAHNTSYKVSVQAIGTGNYSSSAESGKVSVTTPNGYRLNFDNNQGDGTTSPSFTFTGEALTLPSAPTRSGYSFAGWATASSNGTRVGGAGDAYSPLNSGNLVLRYELDNSNSYSGSGTTVNDIASRVNPNVSGNLAGTLVNSPTYSSIIGDLDFGTNKYLRTGNLGVAGRLGTSSTSSSTNNNVSIFAWVYPQSNNGVIVAELGTATINASWHDSQIEMVNGKMLFNVWSSPGSYNLPHISTASTLALNNWYYVGLTYNGSVLTAYVYDSSGQPVAMQNNGKSLTKLRNPDLYYAIAATDSTNMGNGGYGDFRLGSFQVYNVGLSATVVDQNFKNTCNRYFGETAGCPIPSLYATWSQSNYTVTFNANDGSGSPSTSTQSIASGVATALTANSFTRSGYTFAGWNSLANGSGTNYTNQQSVTLTGNLTLYAKWTANTYTVTYTYNNADGGTRPVTNTFTTGGSAITLPTPTRTGYTFAGWYQEVGLSTLIGAAGDSYSPSADATIYAKWTANNNTVTFVSNYVGGASNQTQTIVTDSATNLTTNSFTRTGYTFAGWNTLADGTGSNYTDGQSVTINSALTLYAKWQRFEIEASGDAYVNSGTGSNSNYGSNTVLIFKNAGNSTTNSFNRVAFAKFAYDASFNWSGSALEVYVAGNADGSRNNGYNITYTTFNVDVYGATDASWLENTLTFNLANSSSQGWGINTATWPWNPDSATYLGTISIPTNGSTVGQKFALSNADLDTFLNGDSDGEVTFYFRRSDTDGQANLSFASKENTSYPGPTLAVAEAGYRYTVAYDINGGTGTLPASGTYTDGGSAYTIAATTGITAPAGKTLSGWNTAKDGSGTDYAPGASYSTASSLTLYAKYVNFPTITFNANYVGGPSNITQQVPPSTNTALRQNSFTRTGFTFAGWDTQALGGGTDYADQANINTANSVTLYAQWTASTFTVLYNYASADGGDNTGSATFQTGGSAITLPTPTRTGYTLDGWYIGLYDTKIGNAGATYSPTQNVTLNAKWNPVNYTVTYNTTNSSGGSQPVDSANYNIGQSVTIKSNSGGLYRTGWVFNGWTQNSDGTGTVLTAGQTIQVGSSNIQLYPKWTQGTYTITYNKNSATGNLDKTSDTFTTGGTQVTLPGSGTLAKTGYSFSHWSDTPTGSAVSDPYSTTEDVTLYAVWTLTNYNLVYDLNGGSGSTPTTQVANMTSSVVVSGIGSADKSNHWFAGWNTQADGSGTTYSAGQSLLMPVGGATIYAVWVPDTYQISYNANGGTGGPVLANGFDAATFNSSYLIRSKGTLARDGYNFAYWTVNQDGSGTKFDNPNDPGESDTYTPTGNTTFYAQWTAVSYTFIFNSDGGSNTFSNLPKTINQTFTMPDPGTKNGYTFSAWTDGTTQYPIGTSYRVGTSGKTFTALWTANVYTITYDWQGGAANDGVTPIVSDTYTYSASAMTLPSGTGYSRDGYTFSGWSTTNNGSLVSNFRPTANQVLYAIWADGNYTLSYDGKGAQSGGGMGTVGKGSSVTLPTPVRAGFVFDGWFDDATAGNRIGNGGSSYTPGRSKNLYARWVQKSLYGVDLASLDTAATLSVGGDESGGSISRNHSPTNTSASVVVPNGALPANTVVTARYFKEIDRQSDLIPGENNYIFSLLVSWITGSGDSATVPNTRANKPISVTLNSDAIKAGQMIYQLVGTEVTSLGRAEQDGTITVQLTEDPEIVVAATVPSAPRAVGAVAGSSQATVSWTAPETDGGTPILNYTVTASSGAGTCTTSTTSCVISGLPDGSYTFSVTATNSVGTSASTTTSGPITPLAPTYTVTYDSNGGTSVSGSTFQAGGSVSAPSSPTRSGYIFTGWSTTLDNADTKVTFPYSPPIDNNITLYALWTLVPVNNGGNGGNGGGSTPVVTPTPTPGPTPGPTAPPSQIGFKPTPPSTPVVETGPIGSVVGSSQQVTVVKDAPSEKIIATAGSWQLEIKPPVTEQTSKPVTEKLELQFPVAARADIKGTGLQPNTTVEAWVFSEPTYIGTIKVGSDGTFASSLNLPKNLLPGQHTLQIGSLNAQGQLVTLSIPITIKGSVSVGTFRGFVAIFTKDLAGQELSAKVAGKWIKQNPIKNFKRFNYSRLVRFTGAGYDIVIDVYINKKFYKRYITRTR